MKRQRFRQSLATMLAVVCLFLPAAPVRAEEAGTDAGVMIPVTVKDTSGMLSDSTSFRVTLVGKDAAAPLPAETEYILSAAPEASCEFGPFVFDEPGNYRYLIRQEKLTGDDTAITDQTVYIATVVVITDNGALSATVEVRKENENQKRAALVFENSDQRVQQNKANGGNNFQSAKDDNAQSAKGDDDKKAGDHTLSDQIEKFFSPRTGEPLSFAPLGLLISGGLFALWTIRRRKQADTSDAATEKSAMSPMPS